MKTQSCKTIMPKLKQVNKKVQRNKKGKHLLQIKINHLENHAGTGKIFGNKVKINYCF